MGNCRIDRPRNATGNLFAFLKPCATKALRRGTGTSPPCSTAISSAGVFFIIAPEKWLRGTLPVLPSLPQLGLLRSREQESVTSPWCTSTSAKIEDICADKLNSPRKQTSDPFFAHVRLWARCGHDDSADVRSATRPAVRHIHPTLAIEGLNSRLGPGPKPTAIADAKRLAVGAALIKCTKVFKFRDALGGLATMEASA